MIRRLAIFLFAVCLTVQPTTRVFAADPNLDAETAEAIATEAYIYFYPLLTMDITRIQSTNIEPGKELLKGPMNLFAHAPTFPPAEFEGVVRPNFDTLYSSAFLDVSAEPVILSAPDTAGRYYLLPILDMWTDVLAAPGKRTSGTQAGHFAVALPEWNGKLPDGVQRINATTPYLWVIGRTQTNGPDDYPAVHKIQAGYRITPLSQWGKTPSIPKVVVDPSVDMKTPPLEIINSMSGEKFFTYAAKLLKKHGPHVTDWSLVERMKRLGIVEGQELDFAGASAVAKAAMEKAPVAGLKLMTEKVPTISKEVNGWQMNTDTMGVYGNFYLKRAIVAMVGLGANQPEDAVYPLNLVDSEGNALNGKNKYTIHFEKTEIPPADAFWSITAYDAQGFAIPNAIKRQAIGDRDKLKFNSDGSLDLYFQSDSPGAEKESNWLPSGEKEFNLTMRLYAPRSVVINGLWAPPVVKRQ